MYYIWLDWILTEKLIASGEVLITKVRHSSLTAVCGDLLHSFKGFAVFCSLGKWGMIVCRGMVASCSLRS